MSIVEALMAGAEADRDVLRVNRERGDRADVVRDLDFCFYAPDDEKAKLVGEFCADNSYGTPKVSFVEDNPPDSQWRLIVTARANGAEHVVCGLSGLMECVAQLFKIAYDGWEGPICT